jgi:hypothetical protein
VSEDDLEESPDDLWDLCLKDGENDQDCPPYQPGMVVISAPRPGNRLRRVPVDFRRRGRFVRVKDVDKTPEAS